MQLVDYYVESRLLKLLFLLLLTKKFVEQLPRPFGIRLSLYYRYHSLKLVILIVIATNAVKFRRKADQIRG